MVAIDKSHSQALKILDGFVQNILDGRNGIFRSTSDADASDFVGEYHRHSPRFSPDIEDDLYHETLGNSSEPYIAKSVAIAPAEGPDSEDVMTRVGRIAFCVGTGFIFFHQAITRRLPTIPVHLAIE